MVNTTYTEAAIDIGTNTMLLLVAEIEKTNNSFGTLNGVHKISKILEDQIDFVRLGEGVHQNRFFTEASMQRAMACFEKYRKISGRYNPSRIYAVATSASRDAGNSLNFYNKVQKELGIQTTIINGKTEAQLSFLGGLTEGADPLHSMILDIGGGSTELVTLTTQGKIEGQSIDTGCVRATEVFLKTLPYVETELSKMEIFLTKKWDEINPQLRAELKQKNWIAIAGTPTTLAALDLKLVEWDRKKVDGTVLSMDTVKKLYKEIALKTPDELKENPVIGSGRADILVAGTAILFTAMKYFGKKEVIVSSSGLRHGVLKCPQLLHGEAS